MNDLVWKTAVELTAALRTGALSARELAEATYAQIDLWNPEVNAIVSLRDRDDVLAEADEADRRQRSGEALPALHGLPMAVKDLADVAGLPTSFGSTTTPDTLAATDALFVARLRAAGVIFIGKTNTPEFGTGSHTFNEVFGVTRNAYDRAVSAGGSSGGAAVALATAMVALADGSDLGGSLRNPAAFGNVVGFRPSIGRVPGLNPRIRFMNRFAVVGPMARSVADAALLLSVMAGPDRRDPRSCAEPGSVFWPLEPAEIGGLRVAWGGNLGMFPVEPEILQVVGDAMAVFADGGAVMTEGGPDLREAMQVFRVFRAFWYRDIAALVPPELHGQMKATVRDNVAAGFELDLDDISAAERARIRIHDAVLAFFDDHDVLAMPTTQVAPFPVETEYPTEIEGQRLGDYLDWMTSCCVITSTGCPAISVPAGFTGTGLPVGLQLVAAPGNDRRLLEIAAAFEAATRHGDRRPSLS